MGAEKKEWLTAVYASRLLGKSRRTLNTLADKGVIERRRESESAAWEYSASAIERYLETRDAEVAEAEPADLMLGQAYGAIQTLITPAKQFCEMLSQENAALRKRCSELEARHDELITAREDLLNMKLDRELGVEHARAVEQRKERAFKLIETGVAPKLMALVGGSKPGGAAAKLLGSFTEDQLTLLLNTDLITEEQKAHLREVLTSMGGMVSASA